MGYQILPLDEAHQGIQKKIWYRQGCQFDTFRVAMAPKNGPKCPLSEVDPFHVRSCLGARHHHPNWLKSSSIILLLTKVFV